MYKFSKEKMIKRVTEEGKADMLTPEIMALMDNIDGCEVSTSCWLRTVYQEPVYWVVGKDGTGLYINEKDVIYG